MKKCFFLALLVISFNTCAQWSANTTPDYPQLIAHLQELHRKHPEIELYRAGGSDTEWPVYVCIVNGAQDSLKTFQKARENTTVLVNNAIHAGEPDGVNACLVWLDQWIKNGKKTVGLPVIAMIPAYNVGGMFNRSSTSRVNQEGPEEYGFRGNGRNLDLNRDFIKMDSPNMRTFAQLFHALDPDVFVDTHVSNGADYQYTLTYISSMKERLAPAMRKLTYEQCIPFMTQALKKKQIDLFPYIELQDDIPEKGIVAFNDLPRYAMGYASLFHTLSFTLETHMLKPFPQRVEATLKFLETIFRWSAERSGEIEQARRSAVEWSLRQTHFPHHYSLSEKPDSVLFKGFEAVYKPSAVTGATRLSYDRRKPYSKKVPYFGTYIARDSAIVPEFYVVSVSAREVIARLNENEVRSRKLAHDTTMAVTVSHVVGYETVKQPYEGHYLHFGIRTEERTDTLKVLKGSLIVPTRQSRRTFLLSVLTPQAEDSYFAWNFFDSHLQQKEHFSSYVFEDKALEILASDPALKNELEDKKRADAAFAASPGQQLYFIYRHSAYFERSTADRLPVYMIY